jgi:hypothetical protein
VNGKTKMAANGVLAQRGLWAQGIISSARKRAFFTLLKEMNGIEKYL